MTSSVVSGSRKPMSLGSEEGVRLRLDITSYSAGGESITPTILGLDSAAVPHLVGAIPVETSDVIFRHDRANNKLIATVASTGAEVAGAVDLGEVSLTVIADKK